jgi:transcriptional regulator with XRE-family HTH domain
MPPITIPPEDYRAERRRRGTQQAVADALGIDLRTVQRREAGEVPTTQEAYYALLSLPVPTRRPNVRPETQPG